MTDPIPRLTIKWDNLGATDEFGSAVRCTRCGNLTGNEIGPAIFIVLTWQPVREACARSDDPGLVATLWRIRVELDRGEVGPETEAWLDGLEGYAQEFTREQVSRLIAGGEPA